MSEVARRALSERQRWAAPGGAHDRLIAVARIALPVAIGVLAAFLVTAPLTTGGDVSFVLDKNKVAVARERLKIQQARYRGTDGKGQPFQLTAASAVQKSSAEPVVQLSTLAGQVQLADGPATIRADHGRYDMDAEMVAMQGPVAFRAADGYRLDANDATLDLKKRLLASGGDRVSGSAPAGTFTADHMTADLASHDVRLSGHVHLRIVPARAR